MPNRGELFSHSVESDSWQPHDCSPPGSSVHGISQARVLEWVAISFTRSFQPRDQTHVSGLADRLFTSEPLGKSPVEGGERPKGREKNIFFCLNFSYLAIKHGFYFTYPF